MGRRRRVPRHREASGSGGRLHGRTNHVAHVKCGKWTGRPESQFRLRLKATVSHLAAWQFQKRFLKHESL